MVFGEKNRGRLEVVNYDYKGMRIWSIGYSLCTVYLPGEELNTIKLKNFGYCPATKEFYYNNNVHLPKEIKNYFSGADFSVENRSKMEELGIFYLADIDALIRKYEETKDIVDTAKIGLEIEKKNILRFTKTLR